MANSDVVARARVALFDVEQLSAERLVGIYRVLGEVDGPRHYARRLAEALHTTGHVFTRHGADMGLALGRLTEAIELCRGLDPVEHRDRDAVLRGIQATHQWALYRYGRRREALAVRRELVVLARAGGGDRRVLAEAILGLAVGLVEDGRDDEAESLFAEAVVVTAGPRRDHRLAADRHWYVTAHAGHLATRGRFAEAAEVYAPLLGGGGSGVAGSAAAMPEDRRVPILLYGAHLLAAAQRHAEGRTVFARAVEVYRRGVDPGLDRGPVRGPFRSSVHSLRHDELAHHLAVFGAPDEPADVACATTRDHWSPTRLDRYVRAEPALRDALDASTTGAAERLVLERRLNVRAAFAFMPRADVTDRLVPAFAKAVDHARAFAVADPDVGTPLLVRALTDHALLLATVGRAAEGVADFEEAGALYG
ncbi:hypothetical protein B4N89_31930 [Embleya scabrispora]|uniref:Uncharacterized protein n=1 Tax=Embleya scabrispora TaxID=159449 RepID=A0A1T3NPR7_9ACTN|nr:hypothetical protein [Embleya scabrispora]OPC78764.1 hypothetical protein B4N89_31930 [Embleya scabrispora]